MAMTTEQQKALALASARLRLQGSSAQEAETPPAGLKPGSREYADWALQQTVAGKKVPQVSEHNFEEPQRQRDIPQVAVDNLMTYGRSAIDAVPFVGSQLAGKFDEARAAYHNVPIEDVNAETARMQEENPVGDFVGKLVGPTAALAPLGASQIGARALGLVGSTGSRVGFGLGSGFALGGGDSLSRGNSLGEAGFDALVGAGIGGSLPAAAKGVGWLRDLVVGRTAPREYQNLARALGDDEIPISEINQRIGGIGAGTMVMDLGPNLQSQAGAIASVPGPGQRVVRDAVAQRGRGAPERVQADVDATIGRGPEVGELRENIVRQQQQAATPLYDEIRDVPIEAPPVLRSILQRPQGQQAIRDAVEMAANDGYHFPASGNVMTVGLADYIKRALDDIASAAGRAGRNNEARTARNMARAITSAVDRLEPRYRAARDAFAGPAQVLDAIDGGMATFSKEMSPAQLRRELAAMSPSERDGFLQGAQAQVEAMMGNAVNDAATLRNTFRKGWNEAKLRILLGDDVADDLLHRIDRELTFGQTSNAVASNSETARRTLAQQEIAPTMGTVQAPRGRTLIDLFEGAFNAARNGIEGVRRPQINRNMANLHSAQQLTPDQIRLLQNGARANRPGTLPPASAAIIEQQHRREPVEIVVRGTDPLRN